MKLDLLFAHPRRALFVAVASVVLSACSSGSNAPSGSDQAVPPADGPFAASRPTLRLTAVRASADVVATLSLRNGAGGTRPRVAEIFVRADDGLAFESVEAGEAVTSADKIVRAQPKEDGIVRVVLLAKNIAPLPDGALATLRFRETRPGEHRLEVLTEKQLFAPAKANEGLLVSDPVAIP